MTNPYRLDNPFAPKQYRPDNPFAHEPTEPVASAPTASPEQKAQQQLANYKGIGRALLQGLTFGFGDEIEAGLRSAVGPETYRETRDQIRRDQAAFKQEHPVIGTAAEIGGGLGSALPGVGKGLATAKGMLPKAVELAKVGAAYGAVGGAGTAEGGLKSRAVGAIKGAAIGAPATVAIGGLIAGAGKLGQLGAHAFGRTTKAGREEYALAQLAKVFEDAGLTPDEVAAQVAERRAAGDADLVLGQFLGRSGQQALKASTTMPSEAKNAAFEALDQVKQGASGRLLAATERATGLQQQNLEEVAADLVKQQRIKAKPLYDAVEQIGPIELTSKKADEALGYLMRKMPTLTDDVMKFAVEEKIPLETLVDDAGNLSPKYYDLLKKRLDATLYGKSRGGADEVAWVKMNRRGIMQARQDLLDGVDEAIKAATGQPTSVYAEARAAWQGDEEAKRALQLGRKAFSGSRTTDQIKAELAAMTDGERELYRTAALDAYRTKLANRTTSPVPLLRKNQALRDRLRVIFGDAMESVEQQIASEGQKLDFANALHGSDTAERLTGMEDQGFIDFLRSGPVRGTLKAVDRGLGAGFRKVARDRAAETVRGLTAGAQRPGDLDAQLEALRKMLAGPKAQSSLLPRVAGSLVRQRP